MTQSTREKGSPLRSTGANFYQVRDGKIAYLSSFHDRAPFLKAFGTA